MENFLSPVKIQEPSVFYEKLIVSKAIKFM